MPGESNDPLYVLAGGQSLRFGSDKALADIDGAPMIRRVIEAMSPTGAADTPQPGVTLVTGASRRYESFGYRVVTDRPSGIGPIGGLAAALHDRLEERGPGWLLLTSCDLIRPERRWVELLSNSRSDPNAVVIAFRDQVWQPMLALYHTDLLPTLEHQINKACYSLQRLLDAAKAVGLALPNGMDCLPQANTPRQLRAGLNHLGVA